MCDYPLIKLISLVLFLNYSDFEVEEMFQSRRPAPSEARSVLPLHARKPHIPQQRLGPPAQPQTAPYPLKLHHCPQRRDASCPRVKPASRLKDKPAIRSEVKPQY